MYSQPLGSLYVMCCDRIGSSRWTLTDPLTPLVNSVSCKYYARLRIRISLLCTFVLGLDIVAMKGNRNAAYNDVLDNRLLPPLLKTVLRRPFPFPT